MFNLTIIIPWVKPYKVDDDMRMIQDDVHSLSTSRLATWDKREFKIYDATAATTPQILYI